MAQIGDYVDIWKLFYGVGVGDTVYHNVEFGEGRIQSIEGGYITVKFGTKEKRFAFPDAFLKECLRAPGFVAPSNAEISHEDNDASMIEESPYILLPDKKSSAYSRHGRGWADDVWTPGLPSSRFHRKKKHFR